MVTGEFPVQRPVTRSFDVFFDLRLNNAWVNNGEAGDLKRHRAHYDVIEILSQITPCMWDGNRKLIHSDSSIILFQ